MTSIRSGYFCSSDGSNNISEQLRFLQLFFLRKTVALGSRPKTQKTPEGVLVFLGGYRGNLSLHERYSLHISLRLMARCDKFRLFDSRTEAKPFASLAAQT